MLAVCITFLYAIAASLVSVVRFWQYDVFYYDFGIFDRVLWQVSRFQAPVIDHLAIGNTHIFADHVYPSFFLLAPFYWLTNRPEMLLVIQAVAIAASGYVLFLIGKKLLVSSFLSLVPMLSFYLFLGVQNAIISDVHEVTIMTLPFLLTFWAVIVKNNKRLFFLFLLLTLGFKESSFLLGAGIGLFLLVSKPTWRSMGIITIVLSALWGFIAIKLIVPMFSGGRYLYTPIFPPLPDILPAFFNHPDKTHTLFYSFASFGFLPLLAPTLWPLILQDLITRFIPLHTNLRWGMGFHYSVTLGAILALATIQGLKTVNAWVTRAGVPHSRGPLRGWMWGWQAAGPVLGVTLILISLFLHQFKLHGPLGLAYNPAFYRHTKNFAFLDNLIAVVPPDASVMTQNNLAPRFTHQPIMLLTPNYKQKQPDYILLDYREGQNPNNYFPEDNEKVKKLIAAIRIDPSYEVIYEQGEQIAFRRKKE